jgi:hypothetical protein
LFQRLKLFYDKLLSSVAVNFNVRPYITATVQAALCGLPYEAAVAGARWILPVMLCDAM